jgi:hypothetical protein
MMRRFTFRSLTVLVTFWAFSPLDSAYAGSTFPADDELIGASWTGVTTVLTLEYVDNNYVGETVVSFPDTLTVTLDLMQNSGSIYTAAGSVSGPLEGGGGFGPQGASASIFDYHGNPYGDITGDFFGTYQSILPDGGFDTTNGTATADITFINGYLQDQGEIVFVSFTTVPEPSSLVLAALGGLSLLGYKWASGRRAHGRARGHEVPFVSSHGISM